PITIKLIDQDGNIEVVGGAMTLPAQGKTEGVFFADIPKNVLKKVNTEITIGVYSGEELVTEAETKFMAPAN
ncbi:MAG: cytochrome c oxidase accessory protein CcoG, partial [Hymenobacteraceae bacterium]|nr:cytochrome c oxidase accessory protein CcoG [Hymenobacteraceae bacterium]MDX5395097.1 cytochrome c oxidase accessory protein CcoG [Hymenobacteraceae bacterium]MDX5511135.1 cytochrome c oxidase accessory protein CcoG [Hymenobacteraceae bacterium]